MLNHLPILQVVVPLLAAPACLIIERAKPAWVFACLSSLASLVISVMLLMQVQHGGELRYALGGWAAPWGIEYRIDTFAAYVLVIVNVVAALVMLAARSSLKTELDERRHGPFYVLMLLCLAGQLGIVASGDVFNVFVFLEVSSLATYALVALGRERSALMAAYRYLIVGTIGATFFLFGIGLLYSLTGTLNMDDMAARLPHTNQPWATTAAFGLIVVGIALKLALFPLQGWLPDAYSKAPSIAAVLLAATSTKVALYLLIRMHYSVFGPTLADAHLPIGKLLLLLGATAVLLGSLAAIREQCVKRLLAFSSVAQIGYMVIGLGLGTALGLQASVLHLANHALMKAALFTALAAIVCRVGGSALSDFRGLGRRMPWTMSAFVIGSLSLIGVPLTVGFVSKWYLLLALFGSAQWLLLAVVAVGAFLALSYLWKIVEAAYFQEPESGEVRSIKEAPFLLLAPLWALILANLYFGIDTRLTVGVSSTIAQGLTGAAL